MRASRWVAIVYVVTFAVNALMFVLRKHDVAFFVLGGYGMMWVPGLMAITFTARGRRRQELGLRLAAPRWFAVAFLLPLAVMSRSSG